MVLWTWPEEVTSAMHWPSGQLRRTAYKVNRAYLHPGCCEARREAGTGAQGRRVEQSPSDALSPGLGHSEAELELCLLCDLDMSWSLHAPRQGFEA